MSNILPNLINNNNWVGNSLTQLPIQGCSIVTPYIPIVNMYKEAESIFIKNNKGEINILYSMIKTGIHITKKFERMIRCYNYCIVPEQFVNKQNKYFISKGLITTDNYKILLVVCVQSNTALSFNPRQPDLSKMVVIVSKELEQKHHSLLWNRLKKEFFKGVPNGLDIIKTDDVNKYCMKLPNLVPSFSSFNEMKEHFTSLNKLCLNYQE